MLWIVIAMEALMIMMLLWKIKKTKSSTKAIATDYNKLRKARDKKNAYRRKKYRENKSKE